VLPCVRRFDNGQKFVIVYMSINTPEDYRGKGDGDEEGVVQKGPCSRGCVLGRDQEGINREPRQRMPQMKGLKELKLPVRQRKTSRQI
jgi:hypothetical protein